MAAKSFPISSIPRMSAPDSLYSFIKPRISSTLIHVKFWRGVYDAAPAALLRFIPTWARYY